MADAAKRHLRHAKIKVETCVSVSKESAPINDLVYGSVMKLLGNGLVRVKWEVDNTQSWLLQVISRSKRQLKMGHCLKVMCKNSSSKTKENKRATCIRYNSLTDNDAIDALRNSNKWAGDIFACPPDGNCSDEDSADD